MKDVKPEKESKGRRLAVVLALLGFGVVLFGWLTMFLYRKLKGVGDTPENFKAFVDGFGAAGWLVGFGIQCLQIFIALLPGELVEVGLGYAFGAVGGTLLCLAGVAVASTVVFLAVKRYGVRLVEMFFDRKRIDDLRFINSEKKLDAVVFLLFFIPGTPKDLLTYFVGLTRMSLGRFLCVSLIARIPSVVSSTVGGHLLVEKNYVAAIILFAVTGVVSLLGMVAYSAIVKHKRFTNIPKFSRRVVELFLKLCAIPHGSGNTAALARFCVRFAKRHRLTVSMDEAGNVWIEKPAAAGYETAPPVVLQAHLDMVCETAADVKRDMRRAPVIPVLDEDILRADGTTLGADNGVGIAMILAILEDKHAVHPRLQALFTADEETGMDGALGLDGARFVGERLINLDSETEGVFTLGCAGGMHMASSFALHTEEADGVAVTVSLTGLTGGHSGIDIDKGRANANVVLARMLSELCESFLVRLSSFAGGTVDNGIPIDATATVVLPCDAVADFVNTVTLRGNTCKEQWATTDPDVTVTVREETGSVPSATPDDTVGLLSALLALPNGIQTMSADFEGKPETSLNMGVVRTENGTVTANFALRSFRMGALHTLADTVERITVEKGGKARRSSGYPAWEYRGKTPFVETVVAVYTEQFQTEPHLDAVHAGLECGAFCGKKPSLECISLGPDISGAHTPDEQVSLPSLDRTYRFLRALLAER